MTTEEDHSDDIALAGEYVLHLLDAAERKDFEDRLRHESALRDMVRDWEAQLAPLAEEISPVTPPVGLKSRLEGTLFQAAETRPAGPFWRWLVGGLVAASLILGAVYLSPLLGPEEAQTPTLSASVASEDGTLVVAARYFGETNSLEVERRAGNAAPGRVLELWLIADGATAPVSLGVLSPDSETRIQLSDELAAQMAGAVLAISDEPPGGSPTGAPTGSVLATGPVTGA